MSTIQGTQSNEIVNFYVSNGATKEDADRLAIQAGLLTKLREMIKESTNNSPEESLSAHVALQLPQLKKGKVDIAKKQLQCTHKGLFIASFFPFVGPIIAYICKFRATKELKSTTDANKISQINEQVNQLRIAIITSVLLTVACAVSALVTAGILLGGIALFATVAVAAAATALTIAAVTIDSVQLYRSKHPKEIIAIEENKGLN